MKDEKYFLLHKTNGRIDDIELITREDFMQRLLDEEKVYLDDFGGYELPDGTPIDDEMTEFGDYSLRNSLTDTKEIMMLVDAIKKGKISIQEIYDAGYFGELDNMREFIDDEEIKNDISALIESFHRYDYISSLIDDFIDTNVAVNEKDEYTYPMDKAPKVEGYFKLISLRYPKRVKNIKKCCVDYINGYVDAAMNIVRNNDIDINKEVDTLAKSINYSQKGFTTGDKRVFATSTEGVAFLEGDKAAKEKLDSLLKQVSLYSSKSEALRQWATILVEKSKGIAADLVFKETTKILKSKKNNKLSDEDYEKLNKTMETALKDADKGIEEQTKVASEEGKIMDKMGDYTQVNKGIYTKKDIDTIENANYDLGESSIDEKDVKEAKNDSVNGLRKAWYDNNKSGFNTSVEDTVKEGGVLDKIKDFGKTMEEIFDKVLANTKEDIKEQARNAIMQYALSAFYAKNADLKNGQVISPIDLLILRNSIPDIYKGQIAGTKNGGSIKKDCDLATYGVNVVELNKMLPIPMQLDKNNMYVVAKEYVNTFGDDSVAYSEESKQDKTNESVNYETPRKKYILSFEEFMQQ